MLTAALPAIPIESLPRKQVRDATVLQYLAVLGAAPAPLARLVTRVYEGPKGVTVALHSGMLIYFGDSSRAHAKWLAFASVLVASHATSASYVDVRLPERPAIAGGAVAEAAGASEGAGGGSATAAQGSLASSAALAVGLQAAIGGETGAQGSLPSASAPQGASRRKRLAAKRRAAPKRPPRRAPNSPPKGPPPARAKARAMAKAEVEIEAVGRGNHGALIESSAICNARCDILQSC